ncbi:RIKEN cDNA 2810437L13, isoform CRA_a, partial [Mus musculus]
PARCSAICPASPSLSALDFAVMSTAMNFGTKSFQPRPPDKGSFPLDHFGRVSLCSPGCPGTRCVDQAGLKCTKIHRPLPPEC